MAGAIERTTSRDVADMLAALVRSDGSASHPYVSDRPIAASAEATRNLADAAHYLCTLHGRHPGVVDIAQDKSGLKAATDWLEGAVDGFARERTYLTKLVVAAGPLPSTPGQAASEAAVIAQRHAIEMLAGSDRAGCALGAAMAMVLDWRAVRRVIDTAARRFSVEPPVMILPNAEETRSTIVAVASTPALERAILFGAQQILVQHRGLWDLLEARHLARRDQ